MSRYHTRSKFNPNCPQEDSREIKPNSLVYVPQRPSRTCGPGQLRWQPMSETDLEWARDQARKAGVRV